MTSLINFVLMFVQDDIPITVKAPDFDTLNAFMSDARFGYIRPDAICPYCGEQMDDLMDNVSHGTYFDEYTCEHCGASTTYISPENIHEYHEVLNQGKLKIEIDLYRLAEADE